jgi:hypothetical protein
LILSKNWVISKGLTRRVYARLLPFSTFVFFFLNFSVYFGLEFYSFTHFFMGKFSMKVFVMLLISAIPFHTFAWNSNDPDAKIIKELNSLTQSEGKMEIKQGNMTAKYVPNTTTLTDKIVLKINGKNRVLPGPWSAASKSFREKVRKCMKDNQL